MGVKPMTSGTGMGLAMLLNKDSPKEINLMVSHAWSENAGRFLEDLAKHMLDEEVAFICAFALYQETGSDIQAQLGSELALGPFAAVIHKLSEKGGRMLVVPNEELRECGQGLYSRMWCVWEVFVARSMKVTIEMTDRNTPEHLFGTDSAQSCKAARCGNPNLPMNDDERRIREAIEQRTLKSPEYNGLGRCIGTNRRGFRTGLPDGYAEVDA